MKEDKDAIEAQRRYTREWRKAHPEKVREYNARYWKKRAEKEEKQSAGRTENEES